MRSLDVTRPESLVRINVIQAKKLRVSERALVNPKTGEIFLPSKVHGLRKVEKRLTGEQLSGDVYIDKLKLPNGLEIRQIQHDRIYELSVWLRYTPLRKKLVGNDGAESWETDRAANAEKLRLERLYNSLTAAESENEEQLGLEWQSIEENPPNKALSLKHSMPILLSLRPDIPGVARARAILSVTKRNNQYMKNRQVVWADAFRGWRDLELQCFGIQWAYLTPEVFDRLENCS